MGYSPWGCKESDATWQINKTLRDQKLNYKLKSKVLKTPESSHILNRIYGVKNLNCLTTAVLITSLINT